MKNEEFDGLMQEFRAACVETAGCEYTAATRKRQVREARRRWAPALAAMLVALSAGVTELTLHHRNVAAPSAVANAPAAPTPAVSDAALLSAVDEDLSDRVPQALAPLAVSYTANPSASGQNQKE